VASVAIIQSIHDSIDQPSVAPAFGSLGNPNVLGGYLALVIAVSAGELLTAASVGGRIVLLNVMVVVGMALLLSFSRSAWLAAVIGMAVVALGWRRHIRRLAILVPVVLVVLLALALQHALLARALTMFDPGALAGSRLGIWKDSLRLIASRPLIGYGPDNVGLVFPRFQTGDWGLAAGHIRQPIDKAHLELLQVAATQGVIGVAAYLFILVAFLRMFWRARKIDHAVPIAAGWIAYQVSVQLNFTALASALPFWIFAAAAVATCGAIRSGAVTIDTRRAYMLLGAAVAVGAAVVAWGVATPYLADVRLREAVDADYSGHPYRAQPLAAQARQLNPRESVYAVESGNTAFELGQWAAARAAYGEAVRLGTFNPLVYRNLALADRNLGLTAEAKEAARKAVELDPRDPANQALLAEFGTNP
jgi:O-Antigen ligase